MIPGSTMLPFVESKQNLLYLTKFRSYSLPAVPFLISYYYSLQLITFNIYFLDIMYTE